MGLGVGKNNYKFNTNLDASGGQGVGKYKYKFNTNIDVLSHLVVLHEKYSILTARSEKQAGTFLEL